MNKRGYLTISAVVLSLVMVLGVGIILRPLIGSGLLLREHVKGIQTHYTRLAALERVYALLEKNISLCGECNFPDLDQVIIVESPGSDLPDGYPDVNGTSAIIVYAEGTNIELPFDVYSETDITICVKSADNYYLTLYLPDGIPLFNETASGDREWFIDSREVYNPDSGKYRYGVYRLLISSNDSCLVDVNYRHTLWREAILSTGQHLYIENGFGLKNKLRFLE